MNQLAKELNAALEGSVADRLLSDLGRRLYFPKGIVAQSAEASARANRYNATVGMAYSGGEPIVLPSLYSQISAISRKEAVAYAPTGGILELRNLWQAEMHRKNPSLREGRHSLPLVTPGLTNGIFQAATLFTDPGDVIVIPDMFWGNYRLIFEEQKRAKIVSFPFFSDNGGLNVPALERTLGDNAVATPAGGRRITLLLNFPNNPTGYSPTVSEARELVAALTRLAESGVDLLVITDDAYFGLFYEKDTCRESLFGLLSEAHERILIVKVDGATKEEFVWGFRIGFMTFASPGLTQAHYAALEKKLMGAVRSSISNSSSLAQSLLIRLMKSPTYHAEKETEFALLAERYRTVRRIVSEREGSGSPLSALPFNSGYFMSFATNGISAEELRLTLLDEGIGTISIQDAFLRVAFASIDNADLVPLYDAIFAAAERIRKRSA